MVKDDRNVKIFISCSQNVSLCRIMQVLFVETWESFMDIFINLLYLCASVVNEFLGMTRERDNWVGVKICTIIPE